MMLYVVVVNNNAFVVALADVTINIVATVAAWEAKMQTAATRLEKQTPQYSVQPLLKGRTVYSIN